MACHTPVGRMFKKVCCFLTSFAAINVGLYPFGINVLESNFMMKMPALIMPLHYVIGIAGVCGMVHLIRKCVKGSTCCSSSSNSCQK